MAMPHATPGTQCELVVERSEGSASGKPFWHICCSAHGCQGNHRHYTNAVWLAWQLYTHVGGRGCDPYER